MAATGGLVTFGFGRRKYVWMLAALIAMQVAQPYLAYESVPARILSAALLFTAGFSVFIAALNPGRQRWWAAALVVPVVIVEIIYDTLPKSFQPPLASVYYICVNSFLAFVVALILLRLFHKRFLEIDDVIGAFAGYMILTVLWGNLYALTELLVPGSFSIDQKIAWQLQEWHTRRALFDFFSFATISGVGYGDMSTTSPTSNSLKWLEVMCGQFYIAIVVASIVGMKLAQAIKPGSSEGR
jgi:hypothetical protein